MWTSIIGPIGSGKNFVATALKQIGYTEVTNNVFDHRINSSSNFDKEFGHCLKKMKNHYDASFSMDRENLFTVGDFFWQKKMLLSAFEAERLTKKEFDIINNMMSIWTEDMVTPPHLVIVMTTPRLESKFRREMSNSDCEDLFIDKQFQHFNELRSQIHIPVIEINVAEGAEKVKQDLEFNLSSIKSMSLGNQRIWKRSYLK